MPHDFRPTLKNLAAQAQIEPLQGKTIAVLGFGAQGSAHALNLRDAGLEVLVAQRPGGHRHAAAQAAGFTPVTISNAAQRSDLLIFALPDDAAPAIYRSEIEPHLRPGQTLGFMHGFVIHYQAIQPRPDIDVVMIAPKAQGQGVRDAFVAGTGVLALVAIAQNATGQALQTALAWAAGIGANRTGILQTTFKDETETDLFGEQSVLCGGLTALIQAGFDALVNAGYPPELAYSECCHEVKLIVDLIHAGGIGHMRDRISTTARFGDLTRGPRVIGDSVRQAMQSVLTEVRNGQFAREFLSRTPATSNNPQTANLAELEAVGRYVRELMQGRTPE